MRIRVLMENTAQDGLACEHGLSLYIETCGKRTLFDAGQSAAFADNAAAMGVDLSAVDFAILSHGHYDHSDGFMRFLEINDHAPVYVHRRAFEPHYHGSERYIGVDPALLSSSRIVLVDDELDLGGGAVTALGRFGIKVYGGVTGDADAAVEAFLRGELNYNPDARCSHHDAHHGEGHECGEHEEGHECHCH